MMKKALLTKAAVLGCVLAGLGAGCVWAENGPISIDESKDVVYADGLEINLPTFSKEEGWAHGIHADGEVVSGVKTPQLSIKTGEAYNECGVYANNGAELSLSNVDGKPMEDLNIQLHGKKDTVGLWAGENSTINIAAKNITVESLNDEDDSWGIFSGGNALKLQVEELLTIKATSKGSDSANDPYAYGIHFSKGQTTINSGKLLTEATAVSDVYGMYSYGTSVDKLNSKEINIKATSTEGNAYGFSNKDGEENSGSLSLNGEKVTIQADAAEGKESYGIWNRFKDYALNIKAKNSEGQGALTVDAKAKEKAYAIYTSNGSQTSLEAGQVNLQSQSTADGKAIGIRVQAGSSLDLKATNAAGKGELNIVAQGNNNLAQALDLEANSTINIKADKVSLEAISNNENTTNPKYQVVSAYVDGGMNTNNKLAIEADQLSIKAEATKGVGRALFVYRQGQAELKVKDSVDVQSINNWDAYGINCDHTNSLIKLTTDTLKVTSTSKGYRDALEARAIEGYAGGQVQIEAKNVDAVVASKNWSYGVRADAKDYNDGKSKVTLTDVDNLNLAVEGAVKSYGVLAKYNGQIVVNDGVAGKGDIAISATGEGETLGIYADHKGKVDISSKTLTVSAAGGAAAAIANTNSAQTNLVAENILLKAEGESADGILAHDNSVTTIKGNTVIQAENAIRAWSGAEVKLNEAKAHSLVLDGDIVLDGSDAKVEANFVGAASSFNGHAYQKNDGEQFAVEGLKLSFADGATWNLDATSVVGEASFDKGSILQINGADFTEQYALVAGNEAAKLNIAEGAQLVIKGMDVNTYKIAQGFAPENIVDEANWKLTTDNAFLEGKWLKEAGNLQASLSVKQAEDLVAQGMAQAGSADFIQEITGEIVKGNIQKDSTLGSFMEAAGSTSVTNKLGTTPAEAVNKALTLGEAVGVSHTAANLINNTSDLAMERLSLANYTMAIGGNGPVGAEDTEGISLWAEYVHGKDDVENMPSANGLSSFKGQFNGAVLGLDFKKAGKYRSGLAFNYGEGDANSYATNVTSKDEYDFWGVGYYGGLINDNSSLIFDINYGEVSHDVAQTNVAKLEASPDTTTLSAGLRLERLYQNADYKLIPYVGARFLSLDTDAYTASTGGAALLSYAPERQNIWLVPVGIGFAQEVVNDNGWTVTPKLNLAYIWAFGDTEGETTVRTPGISSVANMDYTVMDDGSFLGSLGIEAAKGDWTLGLGYSVQKGDYSTNEKLYVDASYSF